MMLANRHMTPVIGIDIHIIIIPPGIPTPLPHPYIGMVMDPMDYIPVIGSTIMVNGTPRGNAGTSGVLGTLFHIPMGGPFAMSPMIGHDSMNFFGSPKTVAQGSYMSAAGFMVMTCNDIGAPLTLKPGKKMKPIPSLYLPTSATIPMPGGKPVMVGGPYVPDLISMAMGLVMSYGMGSLLKGAGRALAKLNTSVLKNFPATQGLGKKLCKLGFEPVDLVTGRVLYDGVDFEIPGVIPLKWERSWYSDSEYKGWLGHGQQCNYDIALHIEKAEDAIVMRLPDGRVTSFPYLIAEGDSYYHRAEKLTMTCIDRNTYTVKNHEDNLTNTFKRISNDYFKPETLSNDDGFSIQFFYDAVGKLEQIIDTAGRRINTITDSEGRITKITATHDGRKRYLVGYSYSEDGDLAGITDALEQTTTMEFKNHLMVKKTDRNGMSFYWEYDGKKTGAKCIKTWGDGGVLSGTIEYGKGENIVTNSLGDQTIYYFDESNLCKQVTDPEGGHTFHEYTEFMEPFRDIDEEGNLTGYTYDDRGNLASIVEANGKTHTLIHDEEDQLLLSVTPGGNSIARTYKDGKMIAKTEADGSSKLYKYNKKGLLNDFVDSRGNHIKLSYDEDYNLIGYKSTDNNISAVWRYDNWGRCIWASNTKGAVEQFTYDSIGRLDTVLEADKNVIKLSYSGYDEIKSVRDSKKRLTEYEYTPMGLLQKKAIGNSKVEYKYNNEQRLVAIVNELDHLYVFGRNGKGEIINETGFDGQRREFERNKSGRIEKIMRPGQKWSKFQYDSNGQVTKCEYSDGSWETFSYNTDGYLIDAKTQNSHITFERDSFGKVIKEIQNGHEIEYLHDDSGRKTQMTTSLGLGLEIKRTNSGNVNQYIANVEDWKEEWKTEASYDNTGQEAERQLPGNLSNSLSYDSIGRPLAHMVKKGSETIHDKSYKWNIGNELSSCKDGLTNKSVAYSYDKKGRLSAAKFPDANRQTKALDDFGSPFDDSSKSGRKYGAGGKLLKSSDAQFKYDEEGNLVRKITSKGDYEYAWMGNGLLASVKIPDGGIITFEYDAIGRRTAKIVSPRINNKTSLITRWIWSGSVPVHEWTYKLEDRPKLVVDESGMLTFDKKEPINDLITWIFEEGTFIPIAKLTKDQAYSILTDYLGTPTAMFDSSGNKVWEVELDIYGAVKNVAIGRKSDCPFRYQGQYEDIEINLYYNRYRYYSPSSGTYISQDPIRLMSGEPNLYAYVDDVNVMIDPLGLGPIVIIGEGQAAVDEATRLLRAQGYDAESMMVPKNQWKGGRLTQGMPQDKFQKAVDWNKGWLDEKIKAGYTVIDIGRDGRPEMSKFYKAELEAVAENNARRIKLKKFGNGETVDEMRTRVKCP